MSMKMKPIILHAHEVRRLLDAGEVQVWRPIDFPLNCLHIMGNPVKLLGDWPLSEVGELVDGVLSYEEQTDVDDSRPGKVKCPYQPGERRWVRETWAFATGPVDDSAPSAENSIVIYRASWDDNIANLDGCWKSAAIMPRWASRLTMEIVSVEARRVQEMTGRDAEAAGVEFSGWSPYIKLWDRRNPRYPWESNPWAWIIGLRRVES